MSLELWLLNPLTPVRAFTHASTFSVRFVPKKVPKAPILCLKTLNVSYMKYTLFGGRGRGLPNLLKSAENSGNSWGNSSNYSAEDSGNN